MATSKKDIDDIVRRVLEKLSGPQDEPWSAPEKTTSDELVLHEPLVSAELLNQRLNGVRRLAVAAGAVITPAAQDVLQLHEVEIRFLESRKRSSDNCVAVGVVAAQVATATLRDILQRAGIVVNISEMCDVSEMVETLASDITKPAARGVMITDETAAALCIANRRTGVRAVQSQDISAMRIAATAVGANLLVINPTGMSSPGLARLVQKFISSGPYVCPEALRRVLS